MGMVPFDPAPGLSIDDTVLPGHQTSSFGPAPPGYVDMNLARFWDGRPQSIGGWESFVATPLTGVCRNLTAWNDLNSALNVAFGTHSKLEVFVADTLYDITPALALPPLTLNTDPFTTHNTTATVDVAQPGHPYVVGDSITISGASAVATVTINGTWTVTAVTTNTWSFTAGSNANANASGGGTTVLVSPQRAYTAGAIDGTGGAGFGTGTYSTGTYSSPSTADFFPRTWGLANYGQQLVANWRRGAICLWANGTGTPAAPLLNSPSQCVHAFVNNKRQVVAVGCNQSVSGLFDPMTIRGSDLEAPTVWFPTSLNNAWENRLEGGSRLVAGTMVGDVKFIFSDTALFQGVYVGDPGQTWRFTRLGVNCGLIGPNAFAVAGQSAYWLGTDGLPRVCAANGEPSLIPCTVTADLKHLAASQQDKIVCSLVAPFDEVWWFYPDDRDGNEVSRYIAVSIKTGLWIHGQLARTAFGVGSPTQYPIGVDAAGNAYYHEKGQTANAGPLAGFWETTAQMIGNGDQRLQIKSYYPDFQKQVGPVSVSIITRAYPQDANERTKGPFMIAPGQSKRDLLADGRLARVRTAFSSVPAFVRQGRPAFDVEGSGLQ